MATTNYISYKCVIDVLENGDKRGYTLDYLNREYKLYIDELNVERRRKKMPPVQPLYPIKRTTFYNWRVQIWKQFGLIINTPVEDNRYVLTNPELLDENKTLRDMLEHLVQDEERGFETGTLTFSKRGRKPKQQAGTGMGFISSGFECICYDDPQFGYQYTQEPETVEMIQFSMALGEALVIRRRERNFVFEPQQLVRINDRWYVAGYSYQYGETDPKRHLTVYDVERLQLAKEEDIINPHYRVRDGFDIYSSLPADWNEHFNPDKVVSLYLRAAGVYLDRYPFCQAQEKIEGYQSILHNLYKVYVKPDRNFFVQYMAYGNEVRVFCPYKKIKKTDLDISEQQIMYLNKLREQRF